MPESLNIPTEQTALRIAAALETLVQNDTRWLDRTHPVGSVYMTFSAENPSVTFGGTWERIKGKFLLAADDVKYKAGSIGGSENVTIGVDNLPKAEPHEVPSGGVRVAYTRKDFQDVNPNGRVNAVSVELTDKWNASSQIKIAVDGSGKPFNIMPVHIVVYVWKRTA